MCEATGEQIFSGFGCQRSHFYRERNEICTKGEKSERWIFEYNGTGLCVQCEISQQLLHISMTFAAGIHEHGGLWLSLQYFLGFLAKIWFCAVASNDYFYYFYEISETSENWPLWFFTAQGGVLKLKTVQNLKVFSLASDTTERSRKS